MTPHIDLAGYLACYKDVWMDIDSFGKCGDLFFPPKSIIYKATTKFHALIIITT